MTGVEKISIALPRELLRAVRAAVESGNYSSVSEVIREALRDWRVERTAPDFLGTGPGAEPQCDLSPLLLIEIRWFCPLLRVTKLLLKGSSRKQYVQMAVRFASLEAEALLDAHYELQHRLSTRIGSDVTLLPLDSIADTRGWSTVFDAAQPPAFSGSDTDSSSTS
jgi:hypothetical protein